LVQAQIEVPHVYTALAEVLKSLSVEKNGTLPGNMGGKPYITAVDAAAETKRQFVANKLIFLPNEEVIKHENLLNNNRLQVSIVIKGTYTIVSTVDGSSVTVSGTGDGLATGTAVASNIGSTNALKNALLRTFLITEQSAEDAGKAGTPEAPSGAQQKVEQARNKGTPPSRQVNSEYKTKLNTEYIATGKFTPETLGERFKKVESANPGKNRAEVYELLYKELESE
jgi:hypothetical protein